LAVAQYMLGGAQYMLGCVFKHISDGPMLIRVYMYVSPCHKIRNETSVPVFVS